MNFIHRLTKFKQIIAYGLLFLGLAAGTTHADDSRESLDALNAALPDSVTTEGKVVYVDFWASWCVPCRHSLPWMQELYNKYHGEGLEIVAVNVDKNREPAERFLAENRISFPVVFDSTASLARLYQLEVMPSTFIYGRDGRLKSETRGFQEEDTDDLDHTVLGLLSEGMKE